MDLKALQKIALEMARSSIKNQLEDYEAESVHLKRKISRVKQQLSLLDRLEKEINKPEKPFVYAVPRLVRRARKL